MSLPEIKPIPPLSAVEQVSDLQLSRYADLVYRRTGIRVSPQKKMLLSNRLRRRLRDTGITDFEQYYKHLTKLAPSDPEWDAFLQEITTHETYLFRDEAQWDWFRNGFLAERAAEARTVGQRTLRIWSAACSTGDEPMTVACCVVAYLPNLTQWKVQIVATDIGVGALEQARSGVFGERSMRLVPEDYRRRFFTKAKEGQIWQARSQVSSLIAFKQHNLMEPLREAPFDLVLLKNVLIYFDATSKRKVLDHISTLVRPGGLLVAGAAEGVSDLLREYERLQPWLYRRPASPRE